MPADSVDSMFADATEPAVTAAVETALPILLNPHIMRLVPADKNPAGRTVPDLVAFIHHRTVVDVERDRIHYVPPDHSPTSTTTVLGLRIDDYKAFELYPIKEACGTMAYFTSARVDVSTSDGCRSAPSLKMNSTPTTSSAYGRSISAPSPSRKPRWWPSSNMIHTKPESGPQAEENHLECVSNHVSMCVSKYLRDLPVAVQGC